MTPDEHAAEAAKLLAAAAGALAEAAADPDTAVSDGVREYLAPYLAMANAHAVLALRLGHVEAAQATPSPPPLHMTFDGSVYCHVGETSYALDRTNGAWVRLPFRVDPSASDRVVPWPPGVPS